MNLQKNDEFCRYILLTDTYDSYRQSLVSMRNAAKVEAKVAQRMSKSTEEVRKFSALKNKYSARTDGTGLVIVNLKGEWLTYIPEGELGVEYGETIDVRDYVIKVAHDG
jgi:hypothetical protein